MNTSHPVTYEYNSPLGLIGLSSTSYFDPSWAYSGLVGTGGAGGGMADDTELLLRRGSKLFRRGSRLLRRGSKLLRRGSRLSLRGPSDVWRICVGLEEGDWCLLARRCSSGLLA